MANTYSINRQDAKNAKEEEEYNEHGDREESATIIACFTGSIGFFIVLQTAGINLNSLTVLAGGLGIGLGFGLQTLANNFIIGMTLLLEITIDLHSSSQQLAF
ncbi:mechanosensitive ion channel domain-containing protein [Crinalium epipsammum]|uniref:mechanosensitive ion channel domain-containing protein n=1 Tax=Crinalium epipsammum TaxID=241425 RepID=UPI0002DBF038|nr:mechanosensitive ion channel domain-containing protein [Crinalium epipsammum]